MCPLLFILTAILCVFITFEKVIPKSLLLLFNTKMGLDHIYNYNLVNNFYQLTLTSYYKGDKGVFY